MAIEIFIPKMGASIDRVTIGKMRVKMGDEVKKGDILFEIITDKATFDIEADASGTILELRCKEGDELGILAVVGYIGAKGESISETKPIRLQASSPPIQVTPKARKLARENNIDINKIFAGTDKIIKEEDVLEIINVSAVKQNYILVEFTQRKKAEISALSQSRDYLYSSVTVQLATSGINAKVKKIADMYNIRLTTNLFLYQTVASILPEFPNLNAYYTDQGIRRYKGVNLGVAMNPEAGLIVPVIKNAHTLDIGQFSAKFNKLVMKMVKNELTIKDLQEGTFTITDLSSFDVLDFIPIINKSQSTILAVSSEYDSCKYEKGKLIYDPKINLTLAFDHRVTDGKYALQFLQKLKDTLVDRN